VFTRFAATQQCLPRGKTCPDVVSLLALPYTDLLPYMSLHERLRYVNLEPVIPTKYNKTNNADTRRFTTAIRSEKCVVRRFRRCAKVYLHKPI
jgi:hypothetical protein